MRYEVRYLVGGEDHTDLVDASDAAEAASTIQHQHGRTSDSFELLSVHLVEDIDGNAIDESNIEASGIE